MAQADGEELHDQPGPPRTGDEDAAGRVQLMGQRRQALARDRIQQRGVAVEDGRECRVQGRGDGRRGGGRRRLIRADDPSSQLISCQIQNPAQ
ncbi:MAG: hypothetical protein R2851_28480 [Caldilineaceae bacterium]